jgi:hypothetical protein
VYIAVELDRVWMTDGMLDVVLEVVVDFSAKFGREGETLGRESDINL